ncbi:MAG: glycoside hydrolase family 28 protein [Phycisphaerae bacterium]
MPTAVPSDLGARTFHVRDFGAVGDGKSLDTEAIQKAIDAAHENEGGTVLVPAGSFVIAPIELKSNVTLYLSADARLVGTTEKSLYHPARGIPLNGDHTMGDGNTGLVYAANAENVTIEGPGMIDGQGDQVRANGLSGNRRCHLALFYKCTNLRIREVYLYHSSYHTLRICNSSYVTIEGVRIFSRLVGNNDGFHFISADHVNITNCNVRCQDDACALFGSCRWIMVSNCFFSTRWSCFRFGGGIAENVAVSNCLLYQVFGCPIKLRCEPGSRYENMSFSDLVLQECTGPISLGAGPMGRRNRPTSRPAATQEAPRETPAADPHAPATIRNVSFNNISGTVLTKQGHLDDSTFTGSTNAGELHSAIIVNCVEGNIIENISFNNIHLTFGGGGTVEEGKRRELPNVAGEYFALGPIPAYGFYSRNATGLTLNNVRFDLQTPEGRPAVMLDGVRDVAISDATVAGSDGADAAFCFSNVRDVLVSAARVTGRTGRVLQVEGEKNSDITVEWTAVGEVAFEKGATASAVRVRA